MSVDYLLCRRSSFLGARDEGVPGGGYKLTLSARWVSPRVSYARKSMSQMSSIQYQASQTMAGLEPTPLTGFPRAGCFLPTSFFEETILLGCLAVFDASSRFRGGLRVDCVYAAASGCIVAFPASTLLLASCSLS